MLIIIMKKLLIILFVFILFYPNAYAKKPLKVKIYSENKIGGLYGVKFPFIGNFEGRIENAYKKVSSLSQKNCNKNNKNSFIFFKEGFSRITIDSQGIVHSHKSKKGIIPDYSNSKTSAMVFRFFCGNDINDATSSFVKRSEVFPLKHFKISSLWGSPKKLQYYNHKNKEFKLEDISREMNNKIQMSKSALPECIGSPNKSWLACYAVDENDKYKYEGEYGGWDKVSEGLFLVNLLIKRHGYGKATFKDIGITYEGNFFDNDMNGFGIAKWENGAIHIGQWKLNEPYGQGKFTHPDGKAEEGFWNNGKVK